MLGFGLVSIPVRLMPASRAGGGLSLHLLHADDHGRILSKYVCELDGAEVPWSSIVHGYEYERGSYAIVTDEELAGLNPESTQTIDIVQFADASDVDIILYDRPYYVSPEKRGKHAYALLRSTLESSGKVGIARIVLRTREHLAVLKSHGNALVLVLLRYADEILGDQGMELPPRDDRASEAERRVAQTLLDEMTAPFNIRAFHDTQHEQLEKLLAQRGRAKKVPAPKAPPGDQRGGPGECAAAQLVGGEEPAQACVSSVARPFAGPRASPGPHRHSMNPYLRSLSSAVARLRPRRLAVSDWLRPAAAKAAATRFRSNALTCSRSEGPLPTSTPSSPSGISAG